jgi:hypothetical protein
MQSSITVTFPLEGILQVEHTSRLSVIVYSPVAQASQYIEDGGNAFSATAFLNLLGEQIASFP